MPCKFSKIFIDIYSTIDVKQPRLGFKARYFKRSNILLQVYSGVGKTRLAWILIGLDLKWSNLIGLEIEPNESCPPLNVPVT